MVNYRVLETLPTEVADALNEYHPALRQLLFARGITTQKEAYTFLEPIYTDAHDPFLLPHMEAAVERILSAIENKEAVVIYSDYDCDGIPGAVILHDFFKAVGFTNFTNYIPHRHYEGFGFAVPAVEKLVDGKATLIITIDCGTTDHEAVAFAKEKGMDVIITDHHEPKLNNDGSLSLPDAVAVVNPKIGDSYPFADLCGAAVVFKLAQALIARGQERGLFVVPVGHEKWWLDMVGIATVADMVPLTGENRMLAHFGLHVLRKSRRPGLQQLLRKQRVEQRYISEDDIGFTIGPRINAASRMDTPEDAFFLLATNDEGEARIRVAHLEKLNNERKGQVAAMTKEAHKRLKEMIELPAVLVLGNPEWRPALVGLVANKLSEEFGRPAFLWGRDGNGCFKGSCRSEGHTSVVRLMEAITDHLLEHGGHHQSGGFSVKDSHIHTFSQALCQAHADLGSAVLIDEALLVDLAISINDLDRAFINAQKKMAPFGVANPKPVYEISGVVPSDVQVFGKTKEHTKITFATTGSVREAIAFFRLPEQFHVVPEVGVPVKLLAHVEESHFMGRLQTRLRLIDIV